MKKSKDTNSKNKFNEEFATEQDISGGNTFGNSISREEKLYREKEAYDARFTLYKGSISPDSKD